jgi:hypothetical protein
MFVFEIQITVKWRKVAIDQTINDSLLQYDLESYFAHCREDSIRSKKSLVLWQLPQISLRGQ